MNLRQMQMSNRVLYTFITLGILIVLGVGVYAFGTSNPAVFGHSIGELAPPTPCTAGFFLQWSGTAWLCADASGTSAVVDTQSPLVNFLYPYDDPRLTYDVIQGSKILIPVEAYDNVGVSSVKFYVNDVLYDELTLSSQNQYNLRLIAADFSLGNYELTASARDAAGNVANDSIGIRFISGSCTYDGICATGETQSSCPEDCGVTTTADPSCNFNNYCEPVLGETYGSCSNDCPTYYTSTSQSTYPPSGWTSGGGTSGSFVAGVPVLTPSGWVPVEQLEKGDSVFAVDTESKTLVEEKVLDVYVHDAEGLLQVTLEDGKTFGVTEKHPFWDPAISDYRKIGEFNEGDKLLIYENSEFNEVGIKTINEIPTPEYLPVYNLHVSGPNNYVANGVVVHNKMIYQDPNTGTTTSEYCFYINEGGGVQVYCTGGGN